MHDVKGVLDFLGYDELRPPGTGDLLVTARKS